MKKLICISILLIMILLSSVTVFAGDEPRPIPTYSLPYYIYYAKATNPLTYTVLYTTQKLKYSPQDGYIGTYGQTSSLPAKWFQYYPSDGQWYNAGASQTTANVGYIPTSWTIIECNYDIVNKDDGSVYRPAGALDNYPTFDPNWGINYNPLLKYWTLYKEVSGGQTYWNLMFTQFENLKLFGNEIHFAGLGLVYRCENNAASWGEPYQQYPTGSFIDGTIDTTIQTPKRSNHDIWDYTYTSIYFAKTDNIPATDNNGSPIQPVPEPVFNAPEWTWTWDSSDVFGSIGSFLTSIVTYIKDLLLACLDYLGQLLRYIFLNSDSSGIDFSPLITSVSKMTTKFPFSIPWDLKNAITSLQATPAPPNWTINFDSRYFKGGGNITIDFSQFETLAAVTRWGILILFNISLILLAKKLIGT